MKSPNESENTHTHKIREVARNVFLDREFFQLDKKVTNSIIKIGRSD